MKKLKIFHDNNSVFADHTDEAWDYTVDSFTIADLNADDDYIYIAHPDNKIINCIYNEISTVNTNANTMAGEYYNGSSWTSLPSLFDETNGSTRSGFIYWDRDAVDLDQTEVLINGETLHWVRFRPSVTHSSTVYKGINLVFSNDNDLKEENPEIMDHVSGSETTFIGRHQAARKKIVQDLRNKGNRKIDDDFKFRNIDEFDFLDPFEFRQASKFWALHLIYFNISDDIDDKYREKSDDYKNEYHKAIDLAFMSLDRDDDGKEDVEERVEQKVNLVVQM